MAAGCWKRLGAICAAPPPLDSGFRRSNDSGGYFHSKDEAGRQQEEMFGAIVDVIDGTRS